jgi:hypothetical protein
VVGWCTGVGQLGLGQQFETGETVGVHVRVPVGEVKPGPEPEKVRVTPVGEKTHPHPHPSGRVPVG